MKPTRRLAIAIAFFLFSAPATVHAGNLADELLDATHDMRAQVDLSQETIPGWDAPVSDSWTVVSGGSPFTQEGTIEDNTPGLDIGQISTTPIATLEELDSQ